MRKQIGLYGALVYILLVWTIFQEFVLGIMYHYIHIPIFIKLIFFSKDVLLVILYITALIRTKLPQLFAIMQLCYIPFVLIGVALSLLTKRVSMMTALSSARGLILLPAFLTIGYSIRNNEKFIEYIKIKYMRLLVIVALIGIIEYALDLLIGTKKFWTDFVQLGSYMIDIKGAGSVVASNGLPGNFYTYAANGAYTQKRLVSFWAHPLTSGYVLIIPFLFYFINVLCNKKDKSKNIVYLSIVAIALFLTFTRGTILPALAIVLVCLLYRYRTDGGRFLLFVSVILFVGLLGLVVYRDKIFGYIYNGSTSAHLISLNTAIKELGFFGRGAGTFAAATSEGIWTESTYVSIAGQLGLVAVLLYILLFLFPIYKLMKYHKRLDIMAISIALSGIVFLFTGIISEQLCAYTAIAPYYIFAGAALKNINKRNLVFSQMIFGGNR